MRTALVCLGAVALAACGCSKPPVSEYNMNGYNLMVSGWLEDAPPGLVGSAEPDRSIPMAAAAAGGPDIRAVDMVDGGTKQVMIEARITEVTTRFARVIGVDWWNGEDKVVQPSRVVDVVKQTQPMSLSLGGGFGTTRRHDGTNGHPPGCTCSQCRGGGGGSSTGGGVGIGTTVPTGPVVEERGVRVTFGNLGPEVSRLDNTYIVIRIIEQDRLGQVLQRPVLLPLKLSPDAKADQKLQETQPLTHMVVRDGQTVVLGGVVDSPPVGGPGPSVNLGGGTDTPTPQLGGDGLTTQVRLKDGQTVMIGGLTEAERQGVTEDKVPILSKLPFVNRMFSGRSSAVRRSEVIIFITPRIIIQEEE